MVILRLLDDTAQKTHHVDPRQGLTTISQLILNDASPRLFDHVIPTSLKLREKCRFTST